MPDWPEWLSPSAWSARVRTSYHALVRRAQVEREMREEFRHHLEERTAHLVRDGVPPDIARQRARSEFGHEGTFRELARDAKGLESFATIRFSWLDLKVGVRLLRKHPVLNLAAIFALAVGIPVGLAPSHLARSLEAPLPGDTGNRVRAIRYWDPLPSAVAPTWDADFATWAPALKGFSSLGALRTSSYNVAPADGRGTPAAGAQVTEAVFPMLGAKPLIGRHFTADDFAAGAPDVVIIGHALWTSRFGSDPAILGRPIRVGRTPHVVVGVMPEGFGFPANEVLWLPFRITPSVGSGERTRVHVIGQLADGVTAQQATAELTALGRSLPTTGASAVEVAAHARVRAEVVPFGLLYMNLPAGGLAALPEFRYAQAMMFALLLVACGNVAMLVFARTATRLQELAIRTSLGASRGRIVSQIFLETLVLALVAAGLGVLGINWALGHVNVAAIAGAPALPYWLSLKVTGATAISALAFAAISATVAGVIPAVVITGRAIARNIRGHARFRFGRLTGALIVADIAVSVAAVGMAFAVSRHATDLQVARRATGIPADEYLAVEFRLPEATNTPDGGAPSDATRLQLASAQRELILALEREPGVRRATIADALPRMEHRSRPYEVESIARASDTPPRWTRVARVDVGYFAALGTPLLSGRDFLTSDAEGDARVAIVNTAFVERTLEGRDAIGQRVRFPTATDSAGPWHVVVGVVGPLGVHMVNAERGEAVYLPAAPGTINPMQVAVHTAGPPASFIPRVRELALATNPDLVMGRAEVLSEVRQGDWYLVMGIAAGLVALVGVLIALATSGLYAMLSLSVAERTREIGIRAALGASRRALVTTILKRSLVQVGLGAAVGLPLAARFVFELAETPGQGAALSAGVGLSLAAGIVVFVCLGSCLVPTRRILAIQASEAMRAEV